jgi:hypothetical protein
MDANGRIQGGRARLGIRGLGALPLGPVGLIGPIFLPSPLLRVPRYALVASDAGRRRSATAPSLNRWPEGRKIEGY